MADFIAVATRAKVQVQSVTAAKVQAFALTLHRQLSSLTPLRSGQAQANWQVSLSGPSGPIVYGKHPRPGSVPVGDAVAAQEAAIRSWRPGQTLYIFNTLPYIAALNAGSSKQAPAGYIESAVLTARATLV